MQNDDANNLSQDKFHSTPLISSQFKTDGPRQWTLIIDTCCLVNDNGIAAENLIKLANHVMNDRAQNQLNTGLEEMSAKESIDIVIPFKVWSELEHQSKSNHRLAFAARVVIRMLRKKLEANIAAIDGNNTCNSLRSQTLMESREAAANFLSKDFRQSTNDDHILACAMLENERARRKSATSLKVEVVVVTLDNNLAVKSHHPISFLLNLINR